MNRFRVLSIIFIALLFLLSCGEGSQESSSVSWDKAFEKHLNETFVGADSGIVSFKVDFSLIYVEVDDSVPRGEYQGMARAWALKLSEEKQKHSGSNTTAFIIQNDKAYAMISYNTSKGFHSK